MALYLLSAKYVSRGQGRSFAGAAAYRSGEKLYCQYQERTYNYLSRDDVLYKEILLPQNAPIEFRDRQTLCNAVEQAENGSTKWKTARTAKEIIVALPRELKPTSNIILVRDFITKCFIEEGMCADLAIHRGDDKRIEHIESDHVDIQPHNPHAHILLTTRSVDRNGFGLKVREWNDWGNDSTLLRQWRKAWAEHQNKMFEQKGLAIRVSHLSYKDRGIDREPGVHLGPVLTALEIEKNINTKLGDVNRAIEARNEERKEREHIRQLEQEHGCEPGLSR